MVLISSNNIMDCIFCKIAKKELPADIIYENEDALVFKDINPKAPVHLLIIPKKHIDSINHLKKEEAILIGQLFLIAKEVAVKVGVNESGYKLIFNVGKGGGQVIDHLHLHLLGGWDKNEAQ